MYMVYGHVYDCLVMYMIVWGIDFASSTMFLLDVVVSTVW